MNDEADRGGGECTGRSDAGEEDPGAAEGDPEMQRALLGEAAAVRDEAERPMPERMPERSSERPSESAAAARSLRQRWREFDDSRPSAPGEHWIVFGVGVVLLVCAGRRQSTLGRSLLGTAGTVLIGRALSGRDGIRRVLR